MWIGFKEKFVFVVVNVVAVLIESPLLDGADVGVVADHDILEVQ